MLERIKPLRTGTRRKSRGDGRFLDRKALRRDVSFMELMGVQEADQYRRPGQKKPYQGTSCPGEWRWFSVKALVCGEETLYINQRARTVKEAKRKVEADCHIVTLEVRQQPKYLYPQDADGWWQ